MENASITAKVLADASVTDFNWIKNEMRLYESAFHRTTDRDDAILAANGSQTSYGPKINQGSRPPIQSQTRVHREEPMILLRVVARGM